MHRFFDLNGLRLTIIAEEDAMIAPLLPYIGVFEVDRAAPTDFTLTFARGERIAPPAGAELLFEGVMPEGSFARLYRQGESRLLEIPGNLQVEFEPAKKCARVSLLSDTGTLAGTPEILVLEEVLRTGRQHIVHGAALRLPKRNGALALFARSGAGKTTTALALALSGFGFLTDDATVLCEPAHGGSTEAKYSVWGLPRALKVHRRTRDLLPPLAPLMHGPWTAEDEQVLELATLAQVAVVCEPRPLPLAAIVLLQQRVGGSHVFRPAAKADAMVALAQDNVTRAASGLKSDQLKRFEALAAAVAATPVFELRVGDDLSTLARLIASSLGEA
jgi:hypothetical protein